MAVRTGRVPIADVICLLAFALLVMAPLLMAPGLPDLSAIMEKPGPEHWLGTDVLGRDLLLRVGLAMSGGVLPVWGAVLAGTLSGVVLAMGLVAAGQLRALAPLAGLIQALLVVVAAIPLGIVVFAWAAWQEKAGIGPVMLGLGALFMVRTCLYVRDLYRQDRWLEYWQARAAMGGRLVPTLVEYGIRRSWAPHLGETLGFHLRAAVAIEASLSYLGFGIQEPGASFGNMLASHFDSYLKGEWWPLLVICAGLTISFLTPPACLRIGAVIMDRLKKPGRMSEQTPRPVQMWT